MYGRIIERISCDDLGLVIPIAVAKTGGIVVHPGNGTAVFLHLANVADVPDIGDIVGGFITDPDGTLKKLNDNLKTLQGSMEKLMRELESGRLRAGGGRCVRPAGAADGRSDADDRRGAAAQRGQDPDRERSQADTGGL